MDLQRRQTLKNIGALAATCVLSPQSLWANNNVITRVIPSSGEAIPVVGLGTWIQFDVGNSASERQQLTRVLNEMLKQGVKVVDSSPMYGSAETVVGDLTSKLSNPDHFFYATKVWTSGRSAGIEQMTSSMRKMRRKSMDLMQVHNLVDWQTHLDTLRGWKEDGKVRYIGITHYTNSSHQNLKRIIESEKIDFVQCNYSIAGRHAENNLLAAAADNGVAVLINRPYEGGSLFRQTRGMELPDWAQEFDINSWGQYFLKYILSHPAVTCVIPGTSKPKHIIDNMGAGMGKLPDIAARKKMVKYLGL